MMLPCTAAVLVLATISAAEAPVPATAPTPTLESRASEIAALFDAKPSGIESIFAPSFLAAVPPAQLSSLLAKMHAQLGRCTKTSLLHNTAAGGADFEFTFEKGFSAPVSIQLDPGETHRVAGFFIGPPVPLVKTLDAVAEEFKKLPGIASLLVANIDDAGIHPIVQLNADQPLAIGSAFKLYVLAELIRQVKVGERHWNDVIPLESEARSLPSGFLRDWPDGAPMTLHTLASLMISQSDNTATDQLIRTLGREKIEAMLTGAGHAAPARNTPFLQTQEMFKLKGDTSGKLQHDFLAADVPGKRRLLDGTLTAMALESVSMPATPSHIDDIEWFASTSDLARVMQHLMSETAADTTLPARAILAINPGIALSKETWKYAGYKGGSETGVLNLTFLLQSQHGKWFTLSATQNDPNHAVEEIKFIGLAQRAAALLSAQQ